MRCRVISVIAVPEWQNTYSLPQADAAAPAIPITITSSEWWIVVMEAERQELLLAFRPLLTEGDWVRVVVRRGGLSQAYEVLRFANPVPVAPSDLKKPNGQ